MVFLTLALLAACGDVRSAAAPRSVSASAQGALAFKAASETARNFTGDLAIEPEALTFAKGAALATRTLAPRAADQLASRGGDSFAAIALSSGDLDVEVRAIVSQRLRQGAPSLCQNDWMPSYAALVYGRRDMRVTLILFSGADEPGPDAHDSRVCATYAYTAPDGARTRQGVVL
ncbi:MAG TPA: hypothetical protein VHC73_04635 [Vitreimonas sp.]|nr:hypothetical protein [Vitreimonas sp.]